MLRINRCFRIFLWLKWQKKLGWKIAIGVGAEIFGGYYENTQIARKLKSLIKAVPEK